MYGTCSELCRLDTTPKLEQKINNILRHVAVPYVRAVGSLGEKSKKLKKTIKETKRE
jgi:hypothetical protein